MSNPKEPHIDFIREQVEQDLAAGIHASITTRFPPEPNGYLHIGHAKSICLNFGIASDYKGQCNLRFDDTNPVKEDTEYVHAIQDDIKWLGFAWSGEVHYASDYFPKLYDEAIALIKKGLAYVDESSEEDIRTHRGSLKEAGTPTPGRSRSIEDNLTIFAKMKAGDYADGTWVLRAKIDLAASNMKMRDPLMYRIRHVHHHRTGDAWCIYPMYDYAHPLSDAIENITHSICTLEFENNRELYDWFVEHASVEAQPRQYEFARLALDYTIMSKRKLLQLVQDGVVSGWDDPRMPTLSGMRRRGFRPEAIRSFCDMIGVAKNNTTVDYGKLEYAVRDDLNHHAPRRMCVLSPLKVILSNVSKGDVTRLLVPDFPEDIGTPGQREVMLTREIYIERDDFQQTPDDDFFRLAPGRLVRLRGADFLRCDDVVMTEGAEVKELRGTLVSEEERGNEKIWGVLHWVSVKESISCEVRLYDRLFRDQKPGEDFLDLINPSSLHVVHGARAEKSLSHAKAPQAFQFERVGYFALDLKDARRGAPVFNRVVQLKDAWKKAKSAPKNATAAPKSKTKSARAKSRPVKKTRAEIRALMRSRDPALASAHQKLLSEYSLSESDADVLSGDLRSAGLFEAIVAAGGPRTAVAKLLVNELPRDGDDTFVAMAAAPVRIAELLELAETDMVSAAGMRTIFAKLVEQDRPPLEVASELSLIQVNDDRAIYEAAAALMANHADKVDAYRAGQKGLLGFFVGQTLKVCGKKANPKRVKEILTDKLKSNQP